MRRTEPFSAAPARRPPIPLLAAFLLAAAAPAVAVAKGEASVARGFAAYQAALARRDGAGAAAAVTANSLAYYDRIRGLALSATRATLEQLEGTERMLVLGMRHQAPFELLAFGKPEELVAYAVDAALISDTGFAKTELGEVTFQGDRARAWIVVDGQPTRGVLQFAREEGSWKFDLEFAMRSSAGLIAALARDSGMSENEVIFELLARGSGRPVGPGLWAPPVAE